MMRRVVVGLAVAGMAVVFMPSANIPHAMAGDGGVDSGLNPWSIHGALFARDADGVRNVDIPGTCERAYKVWEEELILAHTTTVLELRATYQALVAENELDPKYPSLPPLGTTTEDQYVYDQLAAAGIPLDPMGWVEEEWEVMEFAPGTDVPCTGKGMLPAPPGGFLGIRPDEPPVDPDPCAANGRLPFSPALWTWYPSWHPEAPDGQNGIQSFYDLSDGKWTFTFIPIVLGVEIPVECLSIFPGDEASGKFEEALPAAALTIVPADFGVTGVDTKLWYNFADPDLARIGPLTVSFAHRGTDWTLNAYAWVDAVGWDLDFDDVGDPVWDESIDFPDSLWSAATPAEYAALGGNLDDPARIYVYEAKDNYTVATGVTWRGYFVVEAIGGLGWGFSETYDPVTRWTILPYQVDEIVGRRN